MFSTGPTRIPFDCKLDKKKGIFACVSNKKRKWSVDRATPILKCQTNVNCQQEVYLLFATAGAEQLNSHDGNSERKQSPKLRNSSGFGFWTSLRN